MIIPGRPAEVPCIVVLLTDEGPKTYTWPTDTQAIAFAYRWARDLGIDATVSCNMQTIVRFQGKTIRGLVNNRQRIKRTMTRRKDR